MKCDTHVHTRGSAGVIPSNSATAKFNIQESYKHIVHQYKLAKKRGMDLFVVTDHNIISEETKEFVQDHPEDCMLGCEYYIKGDPGGQDLECLVWNLDEYIHEKLMEVRLRGAKEFSKVVNQLRPPFQTVIMPYSLAHPAYPVNPKGPRIKVAELEKWAELFDTWETRNGDSLRGNGISETVAKIKKELIKGETGGSDDHAGLYTGLTYTVAPGAKIKEEFLQHCIDGNIYPAGEGGSLKKSYQVMMAIGRQFIESEKAKTKEMIYIEKMKRNEIGFFNYFREHPQRLRYLLPQNVSYSFAPIILPFFLRLAARFYKGPIEKCSRKLEKELKEKYSSELEEIEKMVKEESDYIPPYTALEKITHFFIGGYKHIHTEFEDNVPEEENPK